MQMIFGLLEKISYHLLVNVAVSRPGGFLFDKDKNLS